MKRILLALAVLCVPEYMKERPASMKPQPWMLLVLRALGKLYSGGSRDEAFEQDAFSKIAEHLGTFGLMKVMSA
tara:strand:- start:633 stop:854 length:222 start_codon:yes stop_codon:yes gene_type:complete